MYVRRFPASSTEIDDLRKDVDDLRELVLVLAKSLSKVRLRHKPTIPTLANAGLCAP